MRTLSGGEKFLVSLALSLGLSAVVRAQAGGVAMEAIFIDEGFGSLDPASIRDALDVPDPHRAGGKVGIISHVEALRETSSRASRSSRARPAAASACTSEKIFAPPQRRAILYMRPSRKAKHAKEEDPAAGPGPAADDDGAVLRRSFIDEGFGSLDPASIRDALDVLTRIGAGGKVGIISHVEALRENILQGIEVVKGKAGSRVRLHV